MNVGQTSVRRCIMRELMPFICVTYNNINGKDTCRLHLLTVEYSFAEEGKVVFYRVLWVYPT